MSNRNWICCGLLFASALLGRLQNNGTPELVLAAYDTKAITIPANTMATLAGFTLEGDTAGKNAFDVITVDSGTVVSLVLPSGFTVTNANATSLGYRKLLDSLLYRALKAVLASAMSDWRSEQDFGSCTRWPGKDSVQNEGHNIIHAVA
jgi:hypothetical protein